MKTDPASTGRQNAREALDLDRILRRAVVDGISLERALGIGRQWRSQMRTSMCREIVAKLLFSGEPHLPAAKRIHRALISRRPAQGEEYLLLCLLLQLRGGRVPSPDTIRAWLKGAAGGRLNEHRKNDAQGRTVSTFSGNTTIFHLMKPRALKFRTSSPI